MKGLAKTHTERFCWSFFVSVTWYRGKLLWEIDLFCGFVVCGETGMILLSISVSLIEDVEDMQLEVITERRRWIWHVIVIC